MNEFLLQHIPLIVYLFIIGMMETLTSLCITELMALYLDMSPESKKICIVLQMKALFVWSYLYIKTNPLLPQDQAGYFYSSTCLAVLLTTMVFTYFSNKILASQKKE